MRNAAKTNGLTAAMEDLMDCVHDIEQQVGELCLGAAQTCLSMQQLHKRLVLFQHHIDQVLLAQSCASGAEETRTVNKDELDRSNTKRKGYLAFALKSHSSSISQ